MENASKALIIAAEILFGVILISIFIFLYYVWNNFSGNINSKIEDSKINEFNAQFISYNGRTDLTAHDIVSIVSLANEYNRNIEEDSYKIKVEGNGISSIQDLMSNIPDFINTNQDQKFTLKIVQYNGKNRIIEKMNITKNKDS